MKAIILLSLLLCGSLFAEKVEITADKFQADEHKRTSLFTGHVTVKKGKDLIHADRISILFDPSKKPLRYTATGRVHFELTMQKQHYVGEAQKLLYLPKQQRYEASGDVRIEERTSGKKLFGDKIMIDRRTGTSTITGTRHKPVKMIFSVEE